jgi:hypothetical protein
MLVIEQKFVINVDVTHMYCFNMELTSSYLVAYIAVSLLFIASA